MMMLVTWMAVALMMFMMRPRSLRNKADADYRNNEVGFLVSVVLVDVITQQDAGGRTWQSSDGLCYLHQQTDIKRIQKHTFFLPTLYSMIHYNTLICVGKLMK